MNEEEKKAIEELSKKAVLCNYEERDYPNMICFKKDVLIALNLIEKLQKEHEELNGKILSNAGIYQLGFKDGEESYIKKVKDRIEELKQQNIFTTIDFIKTTPQDIKNTVIQELQELLEGRE